MIYPFENFAVDADGNILTSVAFEVRDVDGNLATLYTPSGGTQTNPGTAAVDGKVAFRVAAGIYTVTTGAGASAESVTVPIGPVEFPTVALLQADTGFRYTPTTAYQQPVKTGDILRAAGFRYQVAASTATDHHLTTAGGVKLIALPTDDGSYRISQFDIDATGATIANVKIQTMIDAVGENAIIKGDPGAVYLMDDEIEPLAGQKFYGNGAKFKRADQIVATLTAGVATGTSSTVLSVDDASGFRVGSPVTVTTGGGNTDLAIHRVQSISGNDLTVNVAFTVAFSAGAQVISAFHVIRNNAADGVEFIGWEFDGNRANYQTAGLRWENHVEIRNEGNRFLLRDCYLHDIPGEGIMPGGDATIVDRNQFINCGGNPIHMSGGDDVNVLNNWIENGNIIPVGELGHEGGGVEWSNNCARALIQGNKIINCLRGFGNPSTPNSDRATIIDNTVIDCGQPFDGEEYDLNGVDVLIENNRFINSGEAVIGTRFSSPTDSQKQTRWTLRGNIWKDGSHLKLNKTKSLRVIGDLFYREDADITGATTCITMFGCIDTLIDAVRLDGADSAIYADSACDDLRLRNCDFRRGRSYALNIGAMDGKRVRIEGGSIITDASAGASYYGISMPTGDRAVARDVTIDISLGGAAGIYGDSGSIVQDCHVVAATGKLSVRFNGGTTGGRATGCGTYPAVSDAGSNTLANNYVLAAP